MAGASDFKFGVAYQVHIGDGLIAKDTTQLTQAFSGSAKFEPNRGFITFPTFSSSQNASGHRKFDVKAGNLVRMRTKVKHLTGDQLIHALRDYREHYRGYGENKTVSFSDVPGSVIYNKAKKHKAPVDHSETTSFDWDDLAKGKQTGAFYICCEGSSSTVFKKSFGAQSLIQLTDIGLVWKQSAKDTTLYAFSIRSGKPLANAAIRLTNDQAALLSETTTDANGFATISADLYPSNPDEDSPPFAYFLDTTLGNDRYVIRFQEELDSFGLWSFSIDQRYSDLLDGERRTLLFTDRNVYKPGDELHVKGISHFISEDQLLGAGAGKGTLTIRDERNRSIHQQEVTLDQDGNFDLSFQLPQHGMGWHEVELDFNPEEVKYPNWRLKSNTSFQVADYRVNTFEINFDELAEDKATSTFDLPLSANYYIGKSLSKAELNWNVYARSAYPSLREFDQFQFGDRTNRHPSFSDHGEGSLSSTGEATISFTLPKQEENPQPRQVSITAQVTDVNQQTISRTSRFTIHPSDFYLGIRKPEGVHRAGDTAIFSFAAVNQDGSPHTTTTPITVTVEKEIWNTVKVLGANGKMTHRSERTLQPVADSSIDLTTSIDPDTELSRAQAHAITFDEAGDYIVSISGKDEQGRAIESKSKFVVAGAEQPTWSWHDVVRIDLIPDKERYQAGDVAKLLVRSPVFGNALLSVERGGVRTIRSLPIDQYETIVEVPIENGDAPNVFASIMIIRGSKDSPHIHTHADYRLGYVQLDVDDPSTQLDLTIQTGNKESYQPGEAVTTTVRVTDHQGNPVPHAGLTLWAVDEGVLSLTDHQTPDPHATFHAPFPLFVKTGQSLRNLLPENPLEQDFGNKGYVIGGGGNDSGLSPERARKDFKATAFWEPNLTTNDQGAVAVSFTAPDNLTEFRIMAVASQGNRFGHGEQPLTINKPLIIEPALPAFTNVTDQVDVSAVIHNNTTKAQEISIAVTLDDRARFTSKEDTQLTQSNPQPEDRIKTVTTFIEAGATDTVSFPVLLTEMGEAKWRWSVHSLTEPTLQDNTESTLKVGYPLPLLRETHHFTLSNPGDFDAGLAKVDDRLLSNRGTIRVKLSNSKLIEAADGLDYLLQYPYGCVEQTTSSLIPWLTSHQLQKVLPELDRTTEEMETSIRGGIQRLFSMQTHEGGLGYWPGDGKSHFHGSAYAGVGIALAQQQGHPVAEEQAASLWTYLSKNLRKMAEVTNTYELSKRCLACYALALAEKAEPAYHEVLFEKRAQLSNESRAILALAMLETGDADPVEIDTLLSPDPDLPVAEISWYRQPYIIASQLLAQVSYHPNGEKTHQLVDKLLAQKQPHFGWGNTYTNAWSLIALTQYGQAMESTFDASSLVVSLGDERFDLALPDQAGTAEVSIPFDQPIDPSSLRIQHQSANPIYASISVEGYSQISSFEPENHGFHIDRTYEKVARDGTVVPADDLAVGDLVLVTLQLNLPTDRETYIAIDDPLPAVFEAINPDFTSQATQKVNTTQRRRNLYANFREIRKDRVLFFADYVYRSGDYAIPYLARVVAPGTATAPPAKIEAMYEPHRFGLSRTQQVTARALELDEKPVASR